jgi:hypothetical protein
MAIAISADRDKQQAFQLFRGEVLGHLFDHSGVPPVVPNIAGKINVITVGRRTNPAG